MEGMKLFCLFAIKVPFVSLSLPLPDFLVVKKGAYFPIETDRFSYFFPTLPYNRTTKNEDPEVSTFSKFGQSTTSEKKL